jgi:hypothetical protein
MERKTLIKLFYRNYTKENYFKFSLIQNKQNQKDDIVILITDRVDQNRGENNNNKNNNNNNELVVLNNISPLKNNQIRSPKIISVKSDVNNKLPLLLVEKVKIPKFINEDSNTAEDHPEGNNSFETIAHPYVTLLEEISIIYKNDNPKINDKYSNMISELNRMPDINFNVFKLSEYSEGNELLVIMCHLMHLCNFQDTLQINQKYYKNYFYLVNRAYKKNSYHNSIHGCDVTQTLYFIFKTCNIEISCNLSELELFSCFFASAIHDLGHPGNNNNYEIATGSTLAISYNDKAVLENYHLCKAFSLLKKPECDIFQSFSRTNYNISRALIINMVLSTDMANHFLDLTLTKNRVKSEDFNPEGADKQLMLNQLIHAADISNPIKPLDIYKQWVIRVFQEFYNQGDKEREQGLKISYLCDRYTVNIIDAQIGFIDNIVFPLYETLSLAFRNMKMIVNLVNNNKEEFKRMKEKNETFTLE